MTTTGTLVSLDKDYGLVILSASAIAFQYMFTPLIFISPVRKRTFTKEYMEKNFGEVHRLEVGGPLPKRGYPDHGNGRYSNLLSYKQWYELNNAYRVFNNFGEEIGIIIPFTLLGGLGFPRLAAGLGLVFFVSRLIYGVGYMKHPNKRELGLMGTTLAKIGLGVLACITGYRLWAHKFIA